MKARIQGRDLQRCLVVPATLMDELLAPGIAARALGHGTDHGSATTAGYIHRRITTVPSAVLDLALAPPSEEAAGQ